MSNKRNGKVNIFTIMIVLLSMFIATACSSSQSPKQESVTTGGSEQENNATEETKVDFPTKDIELIVPYSAGGGFDTVSRLIAPYVEKYLPNDVNVVVINKPGGQAAIAINSILNENPDGHTVGIFNLPGNVVGQVATGQFDIGEAAWLGQVMYEPMLTVTSANSKFSSLDDVIEAGHAVVAASAIASSDGLGLTVTSTELGFTQDMLTLGGLTEAILSVMRGESDLAMTPYSSNADLIDSGELVPLYVNSKDRLAELPDVPTLVELGYDNPGILSLNSLVRAFGVSKNIDPAKIEILQTAFEKAINDPEFQQKMKETSNEVVFAEPEEINENVKEMIKAVEPYEKELRAAVGK
ncbi:Bug family tripartite tricarboxylate transporter substrate binding protein [Bacillus sp. Marseille-P3661]|uniref:Bug family tripartite tricarboxylate transporter substrate binding protein n=1 Tax=Bacillus sp. Marseille-P3661 TaxID=1936234 RepID=UPI000C83F1A6|nr:tripartite tricarboxylate transporter substrate binding protein [Bacillus sp. Marseille-P3661]